MKLHVFDVEHGACAMLTDDNNKRVLIDCGHNGSTGWYPGAGLIAAGIDRIEGLFVTNYDEDHVSGIVDLFGKVHVPRITRNMSVAPSLIRHLKSEDGMGKGIDFLVATLEEWARTGSTVGFDAFGLANIEIKTFANKPTDFDDENNLSMAATFAYAGQKFLFTGDLEEEGWLKLLERDDFRTALSDVEVFFASHHGRENGCCEEVFDHCNPRFIVISDKAKGYQTQETTDWYRERAKGGRVTWQPETRYVLTTRKDNDMVFEVAADGSYTVSKF